MVLELPGWSTDGSCKVAVSTGTWPPGKSVGAEMKEKYMNQELESSMKKEEQQEMGLV